MPAPQSHSETETAIWQDVGGSLSTSFVGSGTSGYFRLRSGNEISVDILPDYCLNVSAHEKVSSQTIDHFLADQVIPRAMAQAGHFIVHAGGVQIGKAAILFVGASGLGKSTLSASFNIEGAPLMGDDAIVLSSHVGEFSAQPVYPSLRLLPDSIQALLPAHVGSTAVSHLSLKRRIDIPIDFPTETKPQPIGAIFKLGEPSDDGRIHLRSLSIADTCMALIENSFLLDPTDMNRIRAKLSAASELASRVPAFVLSYPRDYGRLAEVRKLVRDHLA